MNQTTQDPQAPAAEQNVPGFVRYFQAQPMQVPKALYEAVALELTSRFPPDTLRMWCRVLGQAKKTTALARQSTTKKQKNTLRLGM